MDSNKDDALKCLKIGKAALAAGDTNRARKFLSKARRLDPNLSIDELLAACAEDANNGKESSTENPISNKTPDADAAKMADTSSGNSSGARHYTEEQVEIVRQIKRNKDYYVILGLEKNCSVEDVRKAYRKLSLRVHPDKNKAPGSEEAFKAVSKAFQCLSNEEMRRKYDLTGPEEDFEIAQQHHARRRRAHQGFYDEGFDPDEIFRSFFFGSPQTDFFSRAHVMRTRATAAAAGGNGGGRTHEAVGGFNLVTLLQILPILILFLVTYLPYSEPHYSLQKAHPYQFRKVTKDFGVPYYVRSVDFDKELQPGSPQRADLELQIIRDYKGYLGRYCHLELQRRQWARHLETPHCDQLRQFETVR